MVLSIFKRFVEQPDRAVKFSSKTLFMDRYYPSCVYVILCTRGGEKIICARIGYSNNLILRFQQHCRTLAAYDVCGIHRLHILGFESMETARSAETFLHRRLSDFRDDSGKEWFLPFSRRRSDSFDFISALYNSLLQLEVAAINKKIPMASDVAMLVGFESIYDYGREACVYREDLSPVYDGWAEEDGFTLPEGNFEQVEQSEPEGQIGQDAYAGLPLFWDLPDDVNREIEYWAYKSGYSKKEIRDFILRRGLRALAEGEIPDVAALPDIE